MKKNLLPILLIILAVATRFSPHPANFTAIGAIAMFGGLYFNKKYSLWLPLAAMFISDIFIGFYSLPIMLSVYVGFMIMNYIGSNLSAKIQTKNILAGTLLGSIIFFILTNAAVWAFGTMYAHNLSGLIASYYSALPFFRNSLLGDIFYTTVLVGGYEMIKNLQKKVVTDCL